MKREDKTEEEVIDVERFTIGLTMLIWSLACAIAAGNSSSLLNPYTAGLIPIAVGFLAVLPPMGAYLPITSIMGIFNIDHNQLRQSEQLLTYNAVTCATLKSGAISLPPFAR